MIDNHQGFQGVTVIDGENENFDNFMKSLRIIDFHGFPPTGGGGYQSPLHPIKVVGTEKRRK